MKSMQVKDAITSRQPPRCVPPGATLDEVWRTLRATGSYDLVVTSDGTETGELIGVLSGRALLERGLMDGSAGVRLDPGLKAGDLVVSTPQPATEESDLGRVLATMRSLRITALPLVHGGRLVGLVSETEVLAAIERRLRQLRPAARRGESTGERVVEDVETGLANPLWANFVQLLSEAGI